jgi:hypothetical protein
MPIREYWIHHADIIGFATARSFIGIQRLGSFRGLHLGLLSTGWRSSSGTWKFVPNLGDHTLRRFTNAYV